MRGTLALPRMPPMTRTPPRQRLPKTAFVDPRPRDYKVVSDLPDPLPVTEEELDLLETELSDFIEELLSQGR
jgi:hypothetical protein